MSEPNRQYHQALSANRKLLDENARLKAEVERLTEAHSDALANFWAIHKGYFDLKAEVERLRASSFVTAVPVEEYEKLKAEVERLTQNTDKLCKHGDLEIERLKAEVERLTMIKDACKRMIKRRDKWIFERKAEVERLRKAGDAMVPLLGRGDYHDARINWNAAKEGKQP